MIIRNKIKSRKIIKFLAFLSSLFIAFVILGACSSPLPVGGAWQQIHLRERIAFYLSQGFSMAASVLQFEALSRKVHSSAVKKINEKLVIIWFRLDDKVTMGEVDYVLSDVIGKREKFVFIDHDDVIKMQVEIGRVEMYRDLIDLKFIVLEFTESSKGYSEGGF